MSFGVINQVLDRVITLYNNEYNENTEFNLISLTKLKESMMNKLKKEKINVDDNILDNIFTRLFDSNFKIKKIDFSNGLNSFRELEDTYYPDIDVPLKYKTLDEHFNKLKNLPQPAQRSKEWYDYRYNRITASDTAAAIDLNPYEPVESFISKKCDPNFPFRDTATVFHGKKYEPIATLIYEHIYNTRVFEFGALPSDKYSFLGASPDGICSKYTLDNKFSTRLGTMLEIKCPVTRDIITKGKIEGDICPFYYYCQVQQQLACCELDTCDFWQCKLSEYDSRNDYLKDDCSSCVNTEGTDASIININNKLKKGLFLEFYPKDFTPEFDGDLPEWKSKYIMPRRLDMSEHEYDLWLIKMMDEFKILYPDIHNNYYFYRIVYWKLESSHNVPIVRNDEFLNNIIPILKNTWNDIKFYRENQEKLEELNVIINERKKYVKINTNYLIHNDIILNQKINILAPEFDCKQFAKNNLPQKPVYKSQYKSFITNNKLTINKTKNKTQNIDDSDENDGKNKLCDFIDSDDETNNNNTNKTTNNNTVKTTNNTVKTTNNTVKTTNNTNKTTNNTNKTTNNTVKTTSNDSDENDGINKLCGFIDSDDEKVNKNVTKTINKSDEITNEITKKKTIKHTNFINNKIK